MSLIQEIQSRITILDIWRQSFPESPSRCGVYKSPFRNEKTESFSIYDSGRKFKDHGTSESGDLIDFCCLLWSCDKKEAVRKLSDGVIDKPLLPCVREEKKDEVRFVDAVELARLKAKCLESFTLKQDSITTQFLHAKSIPIHIIKHLHREGSFGMHNGAPAYLYPKGIKVRMKPDSSRSTRWIIGSDAGMPWRYQSLTPKIKNLVLCEGESDSLRAAHALAKHRTKDTRVIAAPSASWRPEPEILNTIAKGRKVIVAVDNDDAGIALTRWLEARIPIIKFPWNEAWEDGDLCELETEYLGQTLKRLIDL